MTKLSTEKFINGLQMTRSGIRWRLVIYDAIIYSIICAFMIGLHPSMEAAVPTATILLHILLGNALLIIARIAWGAYRHILRYGGNQAYIYLLMSDVCAFLIFVPIERLTGFPGVRFALTLSIFCMNLLACMTMRMIYTELYRAAGSGDPAAAKLIRIFGGVECGEGFRSSEEESGRRVKAAIYGAGRLGMSLVSELQSNPSAGYEPVAFIDSAYVEAGRELSGMPVVPESLCTAELMASMNIETIIIAINGLSAEEKNRIYNALKPTLCKIRVYDFPMTSAAEGGRRTLRDFAIEELLPRKLIELNDGETEEFYRGKTVLVTGGGGSIGSELCRQLAGMGPKKLICADFAENSSYELQQELRFKFGDELDFRVEIINICDEKAMDRLFSVYRPEVVLHAAAHKHVPLMEHNCCEAVKNNVFGTKLTAETAARYGCGRFVLISSDKAVNPTNIMGATKRLCEMIVQTLATEDSGTGFCAVRFGNVMGSAGSVIPLFKKQIEKGGPVTLTDRRIIRYFMTISEASHLVLESGAKAKNGELFVLDMGQPVRIAEMAENMIRLSGLTPYKDIDIIETGLRPGEKLYEELLMKSETLSKTDNELIFIEKDEPLPAELLYERLQSLKSAAETMDDFVARQTVIACVPTFKTQEEASSEQ